MILLNLILNLLSNLPDLLRCIGLNVDLLNLCMTTVDFLTCLGGNDSCVVEINVVIIQRIFCSTHHPHHDKFLAADLKGLANRLLGAKQLHRQLWAKHRWLSVVCAALEKVALTQFELTRDSKVWRSCHNSSRGFSVVALELVLRSHHWCYGADMWHLAYCLNVGLGDGAGVVIILRHRAR